MKYGEKMKTLKSEKKILLIPGIYTPEAGFSFDHCHDFRLTVDGVLMTIPNLKKYFANSRTIPNRDDLVFRSNSRVYQQIYFSGVYLYNFISQAGYNVELHNCFISGSKETNKVLNQDYDIIIISTTFTWCPQIKPVVSELRARYPKAKIIIGGRWVWDSYRIWLRREEELYKNFPDVMERYFFTGRKVWDEVDIFIVAEHGEKTMLNIFDEIDKNLDFKNNANCAYWNNSGELTFTERGADEFDVEYLTINWSELPEKYQSTVMPLVAGIGCPFKCKFCDYNLSRLYYKPFDLLRKELRQLNESRMVSTAWFIDDNFLYNTTRIKEFCQLWLEEKFRLNWYGIIRIGSITEETARLMRETGLKMVMLGIESGSQQILDNINKRVTIENYKKGFELLAKYGIRAKILLMVGTPGESAETIQETIDFLNSLPGRPNIGHELFIAKFCLLPLSPLFSAEERAKFNLTGALFDWQHSTMRGEQSFDYMKKLYLQTNDFFQFYPDNIFDMPEGEDKEKLIKIAIVRERLAKHQVAGISNYETEKLWSELEELIKEL